MSLNDKSDIFYHQINNCCTNEKYKKYLKMSRTPVNYSTKTCLPIGIYSKLNLTVTILAFFLLTNCVSFVHSQESNFLFSHGDAIKFSSESNDNHLENLINKNLFSFFSTEMSILDSIEETSENSESSQLFIDSETSDHPTAKFYPSRLDFKEQQIGVPVVKTVYLINSDKEPLKLESISGSTKHFYCSFFVDKVIPVNGNSSFDVYFLAREIGTVESLLYINTNKGILKYSIKGKGKQNEHKLKPILNARIPLNTTFTSVIHLHNPTSEFLQVTEVYSSDDDLHLQVPDNEIFQILVNNQQNSADLKKRIFFQNFNKNKWNLEPFETKPIVVIHFMGRSANNHTAFLCIRATQYSNRVTNKVPIINKTWDPQMDSESNYDDEKEISFVLPIELEVSTNIGIYSPYEQIDFGLATLERVKSNHGTFLPSKIFNPELVNSNPVVQLGSERLVDLYLANSGPSFLSIKNVSLSRPNTALVIDFVKDIVLPPTVDQLTKVAKIKYNPLKFASKHGQILIKTNDTSKSFTINYKSEHVEGSLEYNRNQVKFLIDENSQNELWRDIELLNTIKLPLVVYKIELNQIAFKFFKIYDFKSPVYLKSYNNDDSKKKRVFRLRFSKQQYLQCKNEIESKCDQNSCRNDFIKQIPKIIIFTNLTNFEIPLYIYNNLLIFVKNDPNDKYSIENLLELKLDFLTLNIEKKISFQILNPNPDEISINLIEITKKSNQYPKELEIHSKFKFIKYEPLIENYDRLSHDSLKESHFLLINQKPLLKIPSQTRAIIELHVNSLISNNNQKVFISSNLLDFSVNFLTDFETRSLPLNFRVLNGSINLIDRDSTELSKINLKVFPYQTFTYPINLKSTFGEILNIETLEFRNYGNLFDFNWKELSESLEEDEINYDTSFALVRPNKTTTIGHLIFDPKLLCQENFYLGIETNENYSIKKLSNAIISELDQLENVSMSLIHDIWLKTFKINNLNFLSSEKILQAVDFDAKMLKIMERNYQNLKKLNHEFKSSLDIKIGKKDYLDLNLSISYPIEFFFERPRIARPNSISFDTTQIYLESSTRNITLFNPSKSSVLMQILLLDSYSTKQQFLDLINSNTFLTLNKNITNHLDKIFSVSLVHKHLASHQKINKMLHDLDIQPDKQSIVTIVEPGETVHLKIKFTPIKLGSFENFLIIRNNLTLLETYHLRAEAGTAEIRVNEQAPTHTSNFLNKEFLHKTVDQSFLDIKMSRKSGICESMSQDRINKHIGLFDFNASFSTLFEYLNVLDDSSGNCVKKNANECQTPKLDDTTRKWYKNREGIVLRNVFQVKNIGSTDLIVFKILLDGEPCISQGFEVHNCRPFKLSPNFDAHFHLDIRYQPDFTSSIILKRLTLVTNIGDLEYNIRVNIPHELLSLCHDSLPRPLLESYLIYLCLTLLTFLLTIIFVSAIFESKSIVNFQMCNLKKSIGQKKEFIALKVANEFNFQKDASMPGKQSVPTITRTKSLNENETKQIIKSPRAARKQLNSPKANEIKPKPKKTQREKQNETFGFEPLEIDIKTPSSPKTHKKEEKKLNETALTEISSNLELNETKNKKDKKKPKSNRQSKNENGKVISYKSISSSSSGSISANSSGSSTPSPSISMSPIQFIDTKPKSIIQTEGNRSEFKNSKPEVKKINQQILIQNTIDDTLNNLKKNSQKEQIAVNSEEKIETFKQNLTMLNLLNILNYQQESVVTEPNPNFVRNEFLLSQLKQFYESNQISQTASLLESNFIGESFPLFQNDSMPLFGPQQDISNLINSQNFNENTESFSRSVSIVSKRSPSSESSKSPERIFKPIKNCHLDEKLNCDVSSSQSTPDSWHKIKEDCEFEDTLIVDGFDPNDEYDSMVEQTKHFDSLFFRHKPDDSTIVAKNPLNKTQSVPSDSKKFELETNFHRNIKFGPIERPKSGLKESSRNESNRIYHNSNSYFPLVNQNEENQRPFTFNEFKLFGSETKSDLDSALENLVPLNNSQSNQSQAWNSVLLNEFNYIPLTSSQDPVDSIKNIWSDQFINDNGDNFGN